MMSLRILFERRADVDVAIGERRAVVQHKLLRARPLRLDALIQSGGGPAPQSLGFPLHQVGLHRELRLRQIQRVLVVHLRLKESQA